MKMSVPWALDLWAAHLGHYTNLSGEDLLDTSGLLIFLKLAKDLFIFECSLHLCGAVLVIQEGMLATLWSGDDYLCAAWK